MPQVAEIRSSNISLFGWRRFRVPKLMKQVLVLTLQILFYRHRHWRFLVCWSIWHWIKWTGWSPTAPFLARLSGTTGVASGEYAAFGISPTLESLPFVCRFQGLWIAPKKCEVSILCCYVCLSYLLYFIYWALKCGNWRENIIFQNLTIVVYTIPDF